MKKTIILTLLCNLLFSANYLSSPFYRHDKKEVMNYLSFGLLFTQSQMNGLDISFNNNSTNSIDEKMYHLDFPFKAGGKVIIGHIFKHDFWDIAAIGTVLYSSSFATASQDLSEGYASYGSRGMIPIWSNPRAYEESTHIRYADASANWYFNFYNVELEMGRAFKVGEKVFLRPNFGIKNYYSYQKYNVEYVNGMPILKNSSVIIPQRGFVKMINDAIGIGPKVGIETKWFVYSKIKIIVEATGALLQTYFSINRNEKDDYLLDSLLKENLFNNSNHFSSIKPYAGINFGIGWEKSFFKPNKAPLILSVNVTYSLENYWKINQLIKWADTNNEGAFFSDNNDLQMESIITAFSIFF